MHDTRSPVPFVSRVVARQGGVAVCHLVAIVCLVAGPARAQSLTTDPDQLYREREQMPRAVDAARIWEARAAGGRDFEAAWKLARATYWIGTHGPDAERRAALERGVTAGTQASTLSPDRPEGHFWLAANMGALAESYGLLQGIKYRGRIKSALERVRAIDAGWQQGSADRALGWWYHRVPGLFGGSEEKAEDYLRRALAYNPSSTATLYFLSEVLVARNKIADARITLQRVLDSPLDPDWIPEDRDFKEKARTRLAALR